MEPSKSSTTKYVARAASQNNGRVSINHADPFKGCRSNRSRKKVVQEGKQPYFETVQCSWTFALRKVPCPTMRFNQPAAKYLRVTYFFEKAEYTSYKKRSSMEGSPKVFGGSIQFQSASCGRWTLGKDMLVSSANMTCIHPLYASDCWFALAMGSGGLSHRLPGVVRS